MNDLIHHDTASDDGCICGPSTEPVKRDDGNMGWVVVHHSLDGREMREKPYGFKRCQECGQMGRNCSAHLGLSRYDGLSWGTRWAFRLLAWVGTPCLSLAIFLHLWQRG